MNKDINYILDYYSIEYSTKTFPDELLTTYTYLAYKGRPVVVIWASYYGRQLLCDFINFLSDRLDTVRMYE